MVFDNRPSSIFETLVCLCMSVAHLGLIPVTPYTFALLLAVCGGHVVELSVLGRPFGVLVAILRFFFFSEPPFNRRMRRAVRFGHRGWLLRRAFAAHTWAYHNQHVRRGRDSSLADIELNPGPDPLDGSRVVPVPRGISMGPVGSMIGPRAREVLNVLDMWLHQEVLDEFNSVPLWCRSFLGFDLTFQPTLTMSSFIHVDAEGARTRPTWTCQTCGTTFRTIGEIAILDSQDANQLVFELSSDCMPHDIGGVAHTCVGAIVRVSYLPFHHLVDLVLDHHVTPMATLMYHARPRAVVTDLSEADPSFCDVVLVSSPRGSGLYREMVRHRYQLGLNPFSPPYLHTTGRDSSVADIELNPGPNAGNEVVLRLIEAAGVVGKFSEADVLKLVQTFILSRGGDVVSPRKAGKYAEGFVTSLRHPHRPGDLRHVSLPGYQCLPPSEVFQDLLKVVPAWEVMVTAVGLVEDAVLSANKPLVVTACANYPPDIPPSFGFLDIRNDRKVVGWPSIQVELPGGWMSALRLAALKSEHRVVIINGSCDSYDDIRMDLLVVWPGTLCAPNYFSPCSMQAIGVDPGGVDFQQIRPLLTTFGGQYGLEELAFLTHLKSSLHVLCAFENFSCESSVALATNHKFTPIIPTDVGYTDLPPVVVHHEAYSTLRILLNDHAALARAISGRAMLVAREDLIVDTLAWVSPSVDGSMAYDLTAYTRHHAFIRNEVRVGLSWLPDELAQGAADSLAGMTTAGRKSVHATTLFLSSVREQFENLF